jgi:VWFA-related protein
MAVDLAQRRAVRWKLAFFGTWLALIAGVASGQSAPAAADDKTDAESAQQSQVPTFRAQTTVVTVPTVVKDKHGRHVWALTADDFEILDNGVRQKVLLDNAPMPPDRALVIVVQQNVDSYLLEDALGGSLVDFLNALPEGEIPIAVVTAGAKVKTYMPFNTNRDQVQAGLRRLQPDKDAGGPHLLDGVYQASRMLVEQYKNRRKIVLLLSGPHDGDTTEMISEKMSGQQADEVGNRTSWKSGHAAEDTLRYVEANDVVVDAMEFSSVGMGMSDYWKDPGLSAVSLNLVSLLLHAGDWVRKDIPKHLAVATGGEVYSASRKANMSTNALRIAGDVPAAYDLSFHPTNHTPGLHVLRVDMLVKGKYQVRSRAFYWAAGPGQMAATASPAGVVGAAPAGPENPATQVH